MAAVLSKLLLSVALLVLIIGSWSAAHSDNGAPATGALVITPLSSFLQGTTNSSSTNWAGYDIHGGKGKVSDVQGDWIVPKVVGTCPAMTEAASFWIGIDGDGSNTVEQIGTDTDCSGGSPSYYAWYEFYPAASIPISMTVTPGDHMHGEVSYSTTTAKFTVTIQDLTAGTSFSHTKGLNNAKRYSAEWIAEAPSSGGILPLTNFGSVTFTNATATISGHTHPIGGFANFAITMVNQAGTANKAVPGALSTGGSGFVVTWRSAGP